MADKLIKTLNFGTGDTYHLAPEWDNIQNKPEDIGGGGGKADSVEWDAVQNKPFTKVGGDTLTWDGNTDGKIEVIFSDVQKYYHISDAVPEVGDFANGCFETYSYLETGAEVTMNDVFGTGKLYASDQLGTMIVLEDGFDLTVIGMDWVVFEKKGVYLCASPNGYTTSITINGYTGFAKETINPEALPPISVDWDNVKNKPLGYDYDNPNVLIDNQTFEFSGDVGGYLLGVGSYLKEGNLYEVTLYGETFRLKAETWIVAEGAVCIGNPAFFGGENNGTPFIIACVEGITAALLMDESTESITLSLFEFENKKLDASSVQTMKMYYCKAAESNMYMYEDIDLTTKVTVEDFYKDMQKYPLTIAAVVGSTVVGVYSVLFTNISTYGEAVITGGIKSDGSPICVHAYTAEYTG